MSSTARDIVKALGGDWCGQSGVAPGPGHSKRDRSMWVIDRADGDGVIVGSFSNDTWEACRDYLVALSLLPERERSPTPLSAADRDKLRRAREERQAERARQDAARTAEAAALWDACRPAAGSLVDRYLAVHRDGLERPSSAPVRFHPACPIGDQGRAMPAMVSAVQDGGGAITAVHKTYLTPDGANARRRDGSKVKLSLGPLRDGAVRLQPAGPVLGLAEGVETALAAAALFNVPAWTVLARRAHKVKLPPVVKEVVVFGDNERDGQASATKAADHFQGLGLTVRLRFPPAGDGDFDDLRRRLRREGRL
jgi:putative DNA primase/helicase